MFREASTTKNEILISGYTSNCPDEDKKNGIDFVFLIGKDNPGETFHAMAYKKIKLDCEAKGLKYAILGDGKTSVNLDDITNLPHAHNIVMYGHGGVDQDHHIISLTEGEIDITIDIIQKMQAQTQSKNFFVCSCFGGRIVNDFQNQKKNKPLIGTFISAYSAFDETTWSDDIAIIISTLIDKTTPGEIAPTVSISANLIKKIPQTMVFAYQLENGLASQTLMRNTRKIYLEVERYCEYQLKEFNNFIDYLLLHDNTDSIKNILINEFHDVNIEEYIHQKTSNKEVKLLQLEMSIAEITVFQMRSLTRHILHHDFEVINDLLVSTPSVIPTLRFAARNENEYLSKVIRELLVHRATLSDMNQKQIDLAMTKLVGIDLSEVSFRNIRLIGVNLIETNLTGANLSGADITGADLTGANLTSTIGLNVRMLVSAKSIRDIKIDAQQLKNMSNSDQLSLKIKIMNDYINFIKETDDISSLAEKIKTIIDDKEHPLKFRRIGFQDYGDTSSYETVIKAGSEKLTILLNKQKTKFYQLTNEVLTALSQIAKAVASFEISYVPTVFRQQPVEKSLADQLMDAIPKRSQIESLDELRISFESILEKDKLLDYAKQLSDKIDDTYFMIAAFKLLPPKDRLDYAKYIKNKIISSDDLCLIIQELDIVDRLDYAKSAKDKIQNKYDLQRIIEELPKQDWPDYAEHVISQIKVVDDLSWLMKELSLSEDVVKFLKIEMNSRNKPDESQDIFEVKDKYIFKSFK